VLPSGYHTIHGRALSEFRQMLQQTGERIRLRAVNRAALLAALERNPESMEGAFTTPVESFELPNLIETSANHGLGTLRPGTPIANFIRAEEAMPSAGREISIGGPKKNGKLATNFELTLALELSQMMVLDVLCGQYDRFSGGNLEGTIDAAGKIHFIARDNGGAGMGAGHGSPGRYFTIVSRFDRSQIAKVRRLDQELKADPAAVAGSLQMKSSPKQLAARAAALLARVDALVRAYGEARVYFPD
jgi:hypothetical protein